MPFSDLTKRREYTREYMRAYRQQTHVKEAHKEYNRVRRLNPDVRERERCQALVGMRKLRADPESNKRLVASAVRYQKKRYATDPLFRLVKNLRRRLQLALKSVGKNRPSAVSLLGCKVEDAIAHIEHQFLPGMSWSNYGQWHVDHKRPLSAFDLRDPLQLEASCHFTNLQPLWARDNQIKGSRR